MSVALSLLASVLWGTADFLGGTAARRIRAVSVVGVSQAAAVVALVVVAGCTGGFSAPTGYLRWALPGAALNLVALTAFYAALAAGTMGVVAPIAALGVVVPLAVGVASGDRPTAWQSAGVGCAVAGVVLACGPETGTRAGRAHPARPLVLAGVAAVGFGSVIVCVTHGARSSVVMTLLVMRGASVAVLAAAAAARRTTPDVTAADLPMLAVIGTADVGANAALAVASTRGLLSVVAVLSSLYPAVTVLLARWLHGERLRPIQVAGVAGALTGVVLIASGGGVSG